MPNPGNYASWLRWLGLAEEDGAVAGGSRGGERRRYHFDLSKAIIAGGTRISGTTSPSLEIYPSGGGNRTRIKWDIGDTLGINLEAGLPFPDMAISEFNTIGVEAVVLYTSQVGTNAFNEGAVSIGWREVGGGAGVVNAGSFEFPQTGLVPTKAGGGSFFITAADTVEDLGQMIVTITPAGGPLDECYLHEAYFEVILKK